MDMPLTIKRLCEELSYYNCCLFSYSEKTTELKDLHFITEKHTSFQQDILYLGKVSNLTKKQAVLPMGNFLLIEDVPFAQGVFSEKQGNYLVLPSDTDLLEVFNGIKPLIAEELQFMKNATNLLHTLIQGRGIKYIVKRAAEILNNPVILLDTSYRILAYSRAEKIQEEFWHANIERGYCSFEFISAVKKISTLKKAPDTSDPFIVTCYASPNQKLISKVVLDCKVVGYIVVLESQQDFNQESTNFLSLLSNVIAQEIKNSKVLNNITGLMHENFLMDLLDDKISDASILLERIKNTGMPLNKFFYVLVLNVSNYRPSSNYRDALKNGLGGVFTNIYSIFYKDHIVSLISFKEERAFDEKIKSKLMTFIKSHDLTVGVSQRFIDLLTLSNHYKHTLKVLNLGDQLRSEDRIFHCDDFHFYTLLSSILKKENLLDYCHPAVLNLQNFDKKNDTNYSQTLYYYLLNNQNVNETAKSLFVHRNTMTYRLKKIKELIQLNLDDSETIFLITMSYKIIEFLGVN
ncbi:PucR family transcriptional regulator [Natronincola peptidivorans]|nr:helix-turn-helix domain-containing protein [Natronincola peptidivorans]